jgi:class 3 adenylate cyclase
VQQFLELFRTGTELPAAFTDVAGDAAAVKAVEQLTELVMRERCKELRFMKALEDGFMLCFSDVQDAVGAAGRIVDGMRDKSVLGFHAGVHTGIAIARDGDYFGRVEAFRLAARASATATGTD